MFMHHKNLFIFSLPNGFSLDCLVAHSMLGEEKARVCVSAGVRVPGKRTHLPILYCFVVSHTKDSLLLKYTALPDYTQTF